MVAPMTSGTVEFLAEPEKNITPTLDTLCVDAAAFVDKWRKSRRSERSAAQEHFLDLYQLLHHPKPGA
jgi:hypothetical protein